MPSRVQRHLDHLATSSPDAAALTGQAKLEVETVPEREMRRSRAGDPTREAISDEDLVRASLELSQEDPEYAAIELKFVCRDIRRYFKGTIETWRAYLDEIKLVVGRFDEGKPREDPVFFALERLGLKALRPEHWEDTEIAPEVRSELRWMRTLVWGRIDRWYERARRGLQPSDREEAAKRLKRLGAVLAGDRRGIRARSVTNPALLYVAYRERLFRLKRDLALLAESTGTSDRRESLERVANASGLPVSDFLEYFRVRSDGTVRRPVVSAEQQAKIWTAKRFGVTQHTVANAISAGGGRRYRQ